MPQKLSERPEELVRQFLVESLRPAEMEGYDPQQTDETATDFLSITSDWSFQGDYYPIISVRETDSPVIPNSGERNYNSIQGDGSGPNQFSVTPVTLSVQAVQAADGMGYRNATSARDITFKIYQECHHQVQNNTTEAISEATFIGMTPPTVTRSNTEANGGSTTTWIQQQGTIDIGVIDTP